jgi:hypothetical protein
MSEWTSNRRAFMLNSGSSAWLSTGGNNLIIARSDETQHAPHRTEASASTASPELSIQKLA